MGSNLVSSNISNENCVKAMPGSIPAPNLGSVNKKNRAHTKKTFFLNPTENSENLSSKFIEEL